MSIIKVLPAVIDGCAAPPPSKSAAHRALICAALAGGGSVSGIIESDDMRATINGISHLGVNAVYSGDKVTIQKVTASKAAPVIDCIESGSTLRFLVPVFAACGIACTFTGSGRLPLRPIGVYADCLPQHGVKLKTSCGLPLTIEGRLQPGKFNLPGDVSSQFISGLLFALPLCDGDSDIILTSPLQSESYVDLTLNALKSADIKVHKTSHGWHVPGGQTYRPHDYKIEGDWSQAAFLLALGAVGGRLELKGIDMNSYQGDRAIISLFERMGADIKRTEGGVICRKNRLRGINIDASQIPDLVPVLATVSALADGVTTISGAERLRLKESDRLEAITHCLKKMGAKIEQTADGLRIEGVERLEGGVKLSGFGDHRIVMSLAVAALGCLNPITITDADSVKKSWPSFFEEYKKCGGAVDVI